MQSPHAHDTLWGTPAAGSKLCEECSVAAARYCCPGCGVRTCSLPCSKAHKAASGAAAGSRGWPPAALWQRPRQLHCGSPPHRLLQCALLAFATHAGTQASALFWQECDPASLLLAQ
jgi:hypothetical protein